MEVSQTVVSFLPAKKLKENKQNPRKIDPEQFQKLCNNMASDPEFFALRPCLVNHTDDGYFVYAGNQRLKAAKKLGMKDIPCIVTENTPEDVIKKRIVLDNIHHGSHDLDMLGDQYEIDELLSLGMTLPEMDIPSVDLPLDEPSTDEEECGKCDMCGQKLKKTNTKK